MCVKNIVFTYEYIAPNIRNTYTQRCIVECGLYVQLADSISVTRKGGEVCNPPLGFLVSSRQSTTIDTFGA